MLKILQASLQQYMNWEFQLYKLGFEEAEKPEIKLQTFIRSWRKQEISRKNIYFCFNDYAKAFGSVDHSKLKNS